MFKQFTGLTPVEYIRYVRLAKAAELLRQPDISIADVMQVALRTRAISKTVQAGDEVSPSVFSGKQPCIRVLNRISNIAVGLGFAADQARRIYMDVGAVSRSFPH